MSKEQVARDAAIDLTFVLAIGPLCLMVFEGVRYLLSK